MGGTWKADGIGKGGGQEGGHSKASAVFLSQGPTSRSQGRGRGKGGRNSPPRRPSLTRSRPSPLVESAPWRGSKSRTGFALNGKMQPSPARAKLGRAACCPASQRRGKARGHRRRPGSIHQTSQPRWQPASGAAAVLARLHPSLPAGAPAS